MISGIVYLNPCYNEDCCVKENYVPKKKKKDKITGEIIMSKFIIFVDYLALLR